MKSNNKINISRIDYSKPLTFIFNNKKCQGYSGDTLASALLRNNYLLLNRSFKYGRTRSIIAAGVEEPNAIVSLEKNGCYTPNQKATEVLLYDGLFAVSANNPNEFRYKKVI